MEFIKLGDSLTVVMMQHWQTMQICKQFSKVIIAKDMQVTS
jgi:hypothetical protein